MWLVFKLISWHVKLICYNQWTFCCVEKSNYSLEFVCLALSNCRFWTLLVFCLKWISSFHFNVLLFWVHFWQWNIDTTDELKTRTGEWLQYSVHLKNLLVEPNKQFYSLNETINFYLVTKKTVIIFTWLLKRLYQFLLGH